MVIDVVSYNGEKELFELRYNILKDFVDEFRVIEFDQTFSGKPKSPLFAQSWPKIKSYFITKDIWSKYEELAKSSPNTEYGQGAKHWITEFCQKESIKDCLTDLSRYDMIFIGDCDEIWDSSAFKVDLPAKLKLKVYSYYLNNKSSEDFWGTLIVTPHQLKGACLNHLRSNPYIQTIDEYGWHFTSIGGPNKVKNKLTDSYTNDSYANDWVLNNLEQNILDNKDFMGRDFKYTISEEEWPQYLRNNKDKYKHLCLMN